MIFGIIVTVISFLIDSFLSNYLYVSVSNNNIFIPMFTLLSFIITLPYFNNQSNNYLISCFIFGLIYDITFTNTLLLNAALFTLIGFVIILLDNGLSNNYFNSIIKMLIVIIIFDSLTYVILLMLDYIDYNILDLLLKIAKSLLLNFIYITVFYFCTNVIAKKLHIKKSI